MVEAVIVLPGIMGSELRKGARLIWPGTTAELALPYNKMQELLDPNLSVGDVIRRFSIQDQYRTLFDALELCGFRENGAKRTLVACPYDWRKDNRLAADRLADAVKSLHADHGAGGLELHLVAHSMGGLVARYFLESGKYDEANCPGFSSVKRLVTIGTPHRGAPLALGGALGQVKRLFLSASQVKEVASSDHFPSLYQLLPPPGEPFLWNTDPGARLDPVSPFESAIAKLLGLSENNLASARTFHAELDTTKRPAGIHYFCFVGTRHDTINHAEADFAELAPAPRTVELADGGDGTVPSYSAAIPGMQQLAVGGDHGTLYKTAEVLQALGALLGKPGALSSQIVPGSVRISLKDEVVPAQSPCPMVLLLRAPAATLNGDIVVRKHAATDGTELPIPAVVARIPINYQGAPIQSLGLSITSPDFAGVYSHDFEYGGASVAEALSWVTVQQA